LELNSEEGGSEEGDIYIYILFVGIQYISFLLFIGIKYCYWYCSFVSGIGRFQDNGIDSKITVLPDAPAAVEWLSDFRVC